jgi:hypothetical protein
MFECPGCGWRIDRQSNAGLNIYATAPRTDAALGGLWFDLDALARDAVTPLYPVGSATVARAEWMVKEHPSGLARRQVLIRAR